MDEYSARVKELTEDGWEKDINTEGFRWNKNEDRYKKLYEFQEQDVFKNNAATVDNSEEKEKA